MGFFDDLKEGFTSNPVSAVGGMLTGGLIGGHAGSAMGSVLGPFGAGRGARHQRDAEAAKQNQLNARLKEGVQAGREKADSVYGRDTGAMSADVADIRKRRRERLEQPSRAAGEVRAAGQSQVRRAAEGGASESLQRQMGLNIASAAGAQEEAYYERNLGSYQDMIGKEASTRLAMEPLFGSLYLGSQYNPPPSTAGKGILGGLLGGLGLG